MDAVMSKVPGLGGSSGKTRRTTPSSKGRRGGKILLQPIGAVLLPDREARAHPAAYDVVVHGGELSAFDPGLESM